MVVSWTPSFSDIERVLVCLLLLVSSEVYGLIKLRPFDRAVSTPIGPFLSLRDEYRTGSCEGNIPWTLILLPVFDTHSVLVGL